MPDFSIPAAISLLFVIGAIAGVCGAVVSSWTLRSRLYSLEYDVATLQDNLTREVKKRAGAEGGKTKKIEEDLLTNIAKEPTRRPFDAWWMPYAERAGRANPDQ